MDIASVLSEYFPEDQWELEGFAYEGLNWLSESQPPTEEELILLWNKLLIKREEIQKALESRNKQVEQKLNALGISIADIKNLIGAE